MPRKLLLQMHISINGFVDSVNETLLKWINPDFSEDLNSLVSSVTANVDEILLGRKLAEGFIPAWKSRPASEPGVKYISETLKTVFSSKLEKNAFGENARVLNGDVVDEVKKLKEVEGGGLIVHGGVQLAQTLVEAGLVDELYLLTVPVALGAGARLFTKRMDMKLIECQPTVCGTTFMHYRVKE